MNNETDGLRYALAKQIPDIQRGCVIQTSYGDLHLTGKDAMTISHMLQSIFENKLRHATRIDGCVHCED